MKRIDTRFNRIVEAPRSRRELRLGWDREGAMLRRDEVEKLATEEALATVTEEAPT